MNNPDSKSDGPDSAVVQVMSDRIVWFEGNGDSTIVRVQDPVVEVPPMTDEERAGLEAFIRQSEGRPRAALREAASEIDKLLVELGDASGPMSSIRERVCRIRSLLAEGGVPRDVE